MDWYAGTILIPLFAIGIACLYEAAVETLDVYREIMLDIKDLRTKTWKLIAQ